MPEHPATDNRGEIHPVGEAMSMLLIGQEIDGQRQPAPGQHGDQTLAAKRTDQAIEGHGGEMGDYGAQLQTEATVGGQQGVARDLRAHLARAQDEVREDREHGLAPRTLDAPDGEATQPDAYIMRMAGQTPIP